MNGLMSPAQRYFVDALRQFGALRTDQIYWLLYRKFGIKKGGADQLLRQLHYMGKVVREGNYWCVPWHRPADALLAAFDLMRALCEKDAPEFNVEHGFCQLIFYLPTAAGTPPNSFQVYNVPPGGEIPVCEAACAARDPVGHTVLYLVSQTAQIAALYCTHSYFAAQRGGDGIFVFYEGQTK